jgi:hypothetical protein
LASRAFKSKIISRAAKLQVYKTLIRPVATYGVETWTLTVKCTDMFERKICGPVMENNIWRIRYNEEINTSLKGRRYSKIYQVTDNGACRKNGRQCSARENVKRKAVFQKKKRKTQDEMARK